MVHPQAGKRLPYYTTLSRKKELRNDCESIAVTLKNCNAFATIRPNQGLNPLPTRRKSHPNKPRHNSNGTQGREVGICY